MREFRLPAESVRGIHPDWLIAAFLYILLFDKEPFDFDGILVLRVAWICRKRLLLGPSLLALVVRLALELRYWPWLESDILVIDFLLPWLVKTVRCWLRCPLALVCQSDWVWFPLLCTAEPDLTAILYFSAGWSAVVLSAVLTCPCPLL